MSDTIRKFRVIGPPLPNSEWGPMREPVAPHMRFHAPMVEGVPELPVRGQPGAGFARPLFDPSAQPPIIVLPGERPTTIFRDPSTYTNDT